MHDPRVLLDPATDAVRRLARRGFALDVTSLEKLLAARNAAIHRGDDARAESKRTATSVRSASADERPALVVSGLARLLGGERGGGWDGGQPPARLRRAQPSRSASSTMIPSGPRA